MNCVPNGGEKTKLMEKIGDIGWNLILHNYVRGTKHLRRYVPHPWYRLKKIKSDLYFAVEQEYNL
jgi:hypothetical protein